jgi:hypothetical protein
MWKLDISLGKAKYKVVPVLFFNSALHHEGVLGSEGTAPHIL